MRQVAIDCFPESAWKYGEGWAVVVVDVIRATTSAVTIAATGRRCFTVESLKSAYALAARLECPLLVGELAGEMPAGFDMNNSPVELLALTDLERTAILLSTSGTRLIHEARQADARVLTCLRNWRSTAHWLAGRYDRIAVIGAGSRGEFREEDQLCCAWVGEALMEAGYAADKPTAAVVEQWRGAPVHACAEGNSAAYLRRSGQEKDLAFILAHVNDLQMAVVMRGNEVVGLPMHDSMPMCVASAGAEALQFGD